MPIAIAMMVVAVVIAIAIIGLLWAMVIMLPLYAYFAAAVYLVWRSNRNEAERQADKSAWLKREAERQRLFNEQELRAWYSSIEKDSRTASKREKVLRRFDSARDTSNKK